MLIMECFGLEMPIRTVGEYLNRRGFTPQKPIRRAHEHNEIKVQEWQEVVYPQIVKMEKKEKGEIQDNLKIHHSKDLQGWKNIKPK